MATIEKRTSEKGEIHYRAKIRLKGYPSESATFERLTDARKWVQQTESAIRDGRYFKQSEAKRHTLGEAIDRYCQSVLPHKPKNQRDQYTQLQWWKNAIGERLLFHVTPALIAECRDKLLRGETIRGTTRSPATVNRYLAVLSHLYTTAMKEWGWVDDNALRKVAKPKEPRGRQRFLNEDERHQLLKACEESNNPYLHIIVVLCLSTGARKMEILGLAWKNIDIKNEKIILYDTKNKETRSLPLKNKALELIKEHVKIRRMDSQFVFPNKSGNKPIDITTAWENALKKANITNFKFHDLRHTAASYLAMNGASLAEIADILGHKTLQMVKRYAHLSEDHTASVVEKMNDKIFGEG